jgi:REP element-mobilizing transposase RayT
MPRPRKRLISLSDTPYYHCISRCVRRAFLCGVDQQTGYSFKHRRQWIVDRIRLLSSVFTIDVCAYAVMSNHYHVVLHVDAGQARSLTPREVAARWLKLFAGPPAVRQWLDGGLLSCGEQMIVDAWIATIQHRLLDISWFMRCLNEPIARMANAEDGCSGRFWEGRFKSQALLDETALLQCMAYVDLNPIRAGLASTPEDSDYTAIQRRIRAPENNHLMPFAGERARGPGIPFAYRDYLELVDWSGRTLTARKKGAIPENTPPIMQRLQLDPTRFADYIRTRPDSLPNALGPVDALRRLAQSFGLKFMHGVSGRHSVLSTSC